MHEYTEENFKAGMKVRVRMDTELRKTAEKYSAVPEMYHLKGKTITIKRVGSSGSPVVAGKKNTRFWNWHPDDLIPVDENTNGEVFAPTNLKISTFDPSHLVLE